MTWLWHMNYWQGRMFEFAMSVVILAVWLAIWFITGLFMKWRNKK